MTQDDDTRRNRWLLEAARDMLTELEQWLLRIAELDMPRHRKAGMVSTFRQLRVVVDGIDDSARQRRVTQSDLAPVEPTDGG